MVCPSKSDEYLPSFVGQAASWAPRFAPFQDPGKWGATDFAGKTTIGPAAFQYPDKLAFTLFHEGRHYTDFTTKGTVVWNQPANEVRAREADKKYLNTLFKLTETDLEFHKKGLASERERERAWNAAALSYNPFKKADRIKFRGAGTSMKFEADPRLAKELSDIQGLADDFRNKVLSRARRDAGDRRLARLRQLAGKACADPASITQRELMTIVLPSGDELPRPNILASFGCADKLYYDLIEFLLQGREPSADRIQEMARANLQIELPPPQSAEWPIIIPPPTSADPGPPQPVLGSIVWFSLAGLADMA